jgi:hypothetical protein
MAGEDLRALAMGCVMVVRLTARNAGGFVVVKSFGVLGT